MPPRKRQGRATPKEAPRPAAGRRRSQRLDSSTKKSQYFESSSESESEREPPSKRAKPSSAVKHSGRRGPKSESEESEDDYKAPEDDDDDDDDDDDADNDEAERGDSEDEEEQQRISNAKRRGAAPRTIPKSRPGKGAAARMGARNSEEDEADGVEEGEEDGSPMVTFIPHKKLRDTGGVDYVDERVHPNTMLFLADLKANNKRSWLKANDREYRRSLEDWKTFVEMLASRISDEDSSIPVLPAKDLIFRIFRDIRFSKDPTPYKAHFSAAFSRTGRKGPYACYYVHCEPGSSFVGGGLWHPEADALRTLRTSIDERPRRWRRVLCAEPFRKVFLPKAKAGDEKSILNAFAEKNAADALKTKPKGFDADHRDIQLLKLRNFTISKQVPDDVFTSDDALDKIAEMVGAMAGFITHLNGIVMPDEEMSDEEDGEEEGGAAEPT